MSACSREQKFAKRLLQARGESDGRGEKELLVKADGYRYFAAEAFRDAGL